MASEEAEWLRLSPTQLKRRAVQEAKAALAAARHAGDSAKLAAAIERGKELGIKADILEEAETVLLSLPSSPSTPKERAGLAKEPADRVLVKSISRQQLLFAQRLDSAINLKRSDGLCTPKLAGRAVVPSLMSPLGGKAMQVTPTTASGSPRASLGRESQGSLGHSPSAGSWCSNKGRSSSSFKSMAEAEGATHLVRETEDARVELARARQAGDAGRLRAAISRARAAGVVEEIVDAAEEAAASSASMAASCASVAQEAAARKVASDERSGVSVCCGKEADETPPVYYIYKGARLNSLRELVAAAQRDHPEHPSLGEFEGDELMVCKLRAVMKQYAGDTALLEAWQFTGLAASVAAEMGLDPRRFQDLSVAFDRFDINGDGRLDEEECVLVAKTIMRYYVAELREKEAAASGGHFSTAVTYKVLEDHYELGRKLGQGGQGVVYSARDRASGEQRAVKCFPKGKPGMRMEEVKHEFTMLRSIDHPKIQRLYDFFEDRPNIYIVAEPFYGGHLGDLVENAFEAGVHVTSVYLAKVMHQVFQGVVYLHSKYILHCDLKESNLMIVSDSYEGMRAPSAVVIDFGMAQNFLEHGHSGGTAGYMPPEVWKNGLWTPKGDVHSLGVVLYQLFADGDKCFTGFTDEAIRDSTLNSVPKFDGILTRWKRCTDFPPLVEAMLRKDFRARPTAKACLEDPFFQKRVRNEDPNFDEDGVAPEIVGALRTLRERNKLQKAILHDIAGRLNLAELRSLNDAFSAMDADNDGVITTEEARGALQGRMEAEELDEAVERLVGPSGGVAYTTFMGQMLASKAADENRVLWREFQQLDNDQTGYLDKDETRRLLERPAVSGVLRRRSVGELMALMDSNKDGCIAFDEFQRALSGSANVHQASC